MIRSSSSVTGDARLAWKKDFPTRDRPPGFRSAKGGERPDTSFPRRSPFYEEKGGAVMITTEVQLTGLNGLVTFRA